jgi:DNA mismatch endonuclease (patch repair protein)
VFMVGGCGALARSAKGRVARRIRYDKHVDTRSPAQRSALMSNVKRAGNRSTEAVVRAALQSSDVPEWVSQPLGLVGRPDFVFPGNRLVIFVDGCFWHGCARCGRASKSRTDYWGPKVQLNKSRDRRQRRALRRQGFIVFRVWEHELKRPLWLRRLRRALAAPEPCDAAAIDNQVQIV